MLFYRQACRRDRRARADRIGDVNAGMAGGKKTQALVKDLLRED